MTAIVDTINRRGLHLLLIVQEMYPAVALSPDSDWQVGILLGPFIGALIGELLGGKVFGDALKASLGAFVGFLISVILKVVLCGYFVYCAISELY